VDGPSSECCRLRASGGCFRAGKGVVVVVDNVDGGCAGIVSGSVKEC
jgi:hypothetical protein